MNQLALLQLLLSLLQKVQSLENQLALLNNSSTAVVATTVPIVFPTSTWAHPTTTWQHPTSTPIVVSTPVQPTQALGSATPATSSTVKLYSSTQIEVSSSTTCLIYFNLYGNPLVSGTLEINSTTVEGLVGYQSLYFNVTGLQIGTPYPFTVTLNTATDTMTYSDSFLN